MTGQAGTMAIHETLFIGGQWTRPARDAVFEVVSPATEEVIGRAPAGSTEDLDRAVAAAREAFDSGPWPRMSLDERRGVLGAAAGALSERLPELDRLLTDEVGNLLHPYGGGSISVPLIPYFCGLELALSEVRSAATPGMGKAEITREPVGVVAAIVPWNGPIFLALAKIVPALLAGCTVVLKPAEESPLSAYFLAEAFERSGLPAGTLNIVAADRATSEHLVTHPGVDMVSFTGSTAAGQRIATACAQDIRRVGLELGGKSAAVVLDDADLDAAVPLCVAAGPGLNSGEACSAWMRVLAPRARYDDVVDAIAGAVSALTVGDPADPSTNVGPMVSARQRERVERYIAAGKEDGATVVCGGGRPAGLERGYYVEPTVFRDVTNDMRIAQEEIFGPVVAVIPYDDVDDAVRLSNDTQYGLHGGVLTSDTQRGVEVAKRIRAGIVGVNTIGIDPAYPWGGFKRSGIGRAHGPEGVYEFTESRAIATPEAA